MIMWLTWFPAHRAITGFILLHPPGHAHSSPRLCSFPQRSQHMCTHVASATQVKLSPGVEDSRQAYPWLDATHELSDEVRQYTRSSLRWRLLLHLPPNTRNINMHVNSVTEAVRSSYILYLYVFSSVMESCRTILQPHFSYINVMCDDIPSSFYYTFHPYMSHTTTYLHYSTTLFIHKRHQWQHTFTRPPHLTSIHVTYDNI